MRIRMRIRVQIQIQIRILIQIQISITKNWKDLQMKKIQKLQHSKENIQHFKHELS